MSDPLAPHARIVSVLDPALDPDKFDAARMRQYLEAYDPVWVEGAFLEGVEPTWFIVTQLKQSTLADEIDPIAAETRKLKLAFLHCCHRAERGAEVFEVSDAEWTKKSTPKVANTAWWDRIGDEFGTEILYTIGMAIEKRARLPKSKRGPLS